MPSTCRLILACCGLLVPATNLNAQPAPVVGAGQSVVIPRAEQFDVKSKSGTVYRIFVAGPTGPLPEAGAPVIYLSDGNTNFPLILAAAQRQVRDLQPCVVVGIGYPTDDREQVRQLRSVDLTPVTSKEWAVANAKPFSDLKTGGNDQFLAFIEEELKPVIEQKYKIDRTRQTLFGHSFGGLFVLHVLFHQPASFQTYIAVSPSIWWNDNSLLKEEQDFLQKNSGHSVKARLLIAVGELEQPAVVAHSGSAIRRGPPGRAIDDMKAMSARLLEAKIDGLIVEHRIFAEESHGSVVLPAASRGVKFALDDLH